MKLDRKDYNIDNFFEEIVQNKAKYFGDSSERKWMKTYLMYARDDWLNLFERLNPEKNGDFYYIDIPDAFDPGSSKGYYVTEYSKGLLMFYTVATQKTYAKTLKEYIGRKRGITPMWIHPAVFQQIRQYIIDTFNGNIYRFFAKRNWSSEVPAHYRGDMQRSVSYTAADGTQAIREIEYLYGVVPTIIDFRIGADTMRATNEGLFSVRTINIKMLRLVVDVVENIFAKQIALHNVSTSVKTYKKRVSFGNLQFNVRQSESARIRINRVDISTLLIMKLLKQYNTEELGKGNDKEVDDFAFMDTIIEDDKGLYYSATVIDKKKGTIFGLSGSKSEMILVPMHRTTFESFTRFYKLIAESLDSGANLERFSEPLVKR